MYDDPYLYQNPVNILRFPNTIENGLVKKINEVSSSGFLSTTVKFPGYVKFYPRP